MKRFIFLDRLGVTMMIAALGCAVYSWFPMLPNWSGALYSSAFLFCIGYPLHHYARLERDTA